METQTIETKFEFRILKKEAEPREDSQLFVMLEEAPKVIGNIAFKEVTLEEGARHQQINSRRVYEISGPRKLDSEKSQKVLNHFYSIYADSHLDELIKYYQKGVKFTLAQ